MSDRNDDSGVAADVMRQATDRTEQVASWLEAREPGDLVDEVRRFARRRPGVFLAGAVMAGVLAGRLTRNVVASSQDKGPDEQRPESDWRAENPVATTDYPDFPQTAPATSGYPQEPAPGAVVQPATPGSGPIR
jgi:hypothetical protein